MSAKPASAESDLFPHISSKLEFSMLAKNARKPDPERIENPIDIVNETLISSHDDEYWFRADYLWNREVFSLLIAVKRFGKKWRNECLKICYFLWFQMQRYSMLERWFSIPGYKNHKSDMTQPWVMFNREWNMAARCQIMYGIGGMTYGRWKWQNAIKKAYVEYH